MKKDDLKYDPFRDRLLNIVNSITTNLKQYAAIFISIIVLIGFFAYLSLEEDKKNLLGCLDSDNLTQSSSLKEYCGSNEVQTILNTYKDMSISTLEGSIYFLYELEKVDLDQKRDKLNSINIESFKNNIIKAKTYKLKADLMIDSGLFLDAIDIYLKAHKSYDDKKSFSGLIFYKISQAYFSDYTLKNNLESLQNANLFIEKSLKCDILNKNILKNVEILAAKINHEI